MPLLDGLEATRQIREDFPDTKVPISAHSDAAYVEEAIAFGAVGFLLKQTSSHNVPGAIREAQKGKLLFQPLHWQAKRLHDRAWKWPDRTGRLKTTGNSLN